MTIVRAVARILSVAILLLWGYFLIAHLLGEQSRPSRPLNTNDYIGLAAMVASLVGLLLAWKWEFAGAVTALVAVLVGAIFNWRVLVSPNALILVNSVLFLSCWWMSRAGSGRT